MVGRRRRAATTPFAVWSTAMRAAPATASTLSVRLANLVTGTMTRAESARMVGERLAAATGGMMATSETSLRVVAAAARPAQRRMEAGAKRLTAPKRPR